MALRALDWIHAEGRMSHGLPRGFARSLSDAFASR
jgi:hypothetical protein